MRTCDHPKEPGHTGSDRFERFAKTVGDLDSPFYDEERDRDVWNEASAVGFQLMLWGIPFVAAICLWVGGAPALPYAGAGLVPWAVAAATTLSYAHLRGVDPGNAQALASGRARAALFAIVTAAASSGFLYAASQLDISGRTGSFLRGAAQGAAGMFVVITVVALVVAIREVAQRRRATRQA